MPKKKAAVESNGVHDAAPDVPAADHAPQEVAGGNGSSEKRPPAHTVRGLGRVKATVWINYAKDGRPFYATSVARIYRNSDGEYAQASSFDRGDLLPLAEALRQAYLWISMNPLSNGDDDVPF